MGGFGKRAVEDTAAKAKETGHVPGGRETQEEGEPHTGLWNKKESQSEGQNAGSQPL